MAEDPRGDLRGERAATGRRRDQRIFVVEVWHEGGAFRAAARDVAQAQARRFDEPADLAAYISHQPGREPKAKP